MRVQDLTDASGRKAAADLLHVLLRAPQTFEGGATADGFCNALAELTVKVPTGTAPVGLTLGMSLSSESIVAQPDEHGVGSAL